MIFLNLSNFIRVVISILIILLMPSATYAIGWSNPTQVIEAKNGPERQILVKLVDMTTVGEGCTKSGYLRYKPEDVSYAAHDTAYLASKKDLEISVLLGKRIKIKTTSCSKDYPLFKEVILNSNN